VTNREEVVVLGSGGHAVVCIESLVASGFDVVGVVDRSPQPRPLQVPLLGGDEDLPAIRADGVASAFVAVGDNRLRGRLMDLARRNGYRLVNAVAPGTHISPTVVLGENVAVMAGAVVNAYATLAEGSIVNTGAVIDHDGHVGALAHIGPGCALAGKVTVGEGAFLGVGSSVIPGCRVGRWSQLGAGSVVIRDIGDSMLAMGVPAREVRRLHD
jgi:UDP-perosamine 4-acetyltransferase